MRPDEVILSRPFFLRLLSLIDQQELYQSTQFSSQRMLVGKEAAQQAGQLPKQPTEQSTEQQAAPGRLETGLRCREREKSDGDARPKAKDGSPARSFRRGEAGERGEGGWGRGEKGEERGLGRGGSVLCACLDAILPHYQVFETNANCS